MMNEINAKIMQMQLQYLIYNLMNYKKEEIVQQNLKVAADLLNVNNITSCVQVLNVFPNFKLFHTPFIVSLRK